MEVLFRVIKRRKRSFIYQIENRYPVVESQLRASLVGGAGKPPTRLVSYAKNIQTESVLNNNHTK